MCSGRRFWRPQSEVRMEKSQEQQGTSLKKRSGQTVAVGTLPYGHRGQAEIVSREGVIRSASSTGSTVRREDWL